MADDPQLTIREPRKRKEPSRFADNPSCSVVNNDNPGPLPSNKKAKASSMKHVPKQHHPSAQDSECGDDGHGTDDAATTWQVSPRNPSSFDEGVDRIVDKDSCEDPFEEPIDVDEEEVQEEEQWESADDELGGSN
jgi:hypothetical protein